MKNILVNGNKHSAPLTLVPLVGINKQGTLTQLNNNYSFNLSSGDYAEYIWTTKQFLPDNKPFIIQSDIVNQYGTYTNGHIGVHNFNGAQDNAIAYMTFTHSATNTGHLAGQHLNTTFWNDPSVTLTGTNQMRVRGDGSHIYYEVNYNNTGWVTSSTAPVLTQSTGLYVVGALYSFNTNDQLRNVQVAPDLNGFTPPSPDNTGLTTQELRYDNVQYASQSIQSSDYSTPATNGTSVGAILDKIGRTNNLPLVYQGILNPTVTHAVPKLITDNTGSWVQFDNQPETNYDSPNFTAINPPYEVIIVNRRMPGQQYEAMMENGPNAAYLANFGTGVRVYDQNGILDASIHQPADYTTVIERLVFGASSVDYWQNGVKLATYSYTNGAFQKSILSISTFTNSMDFDFAALYFKGATPFTDTDYTTNIYPSLAAKWIPGTIPNEILLSNIGITKSGSPGSYVYTPTFTVSNLPSGVTAAASSTWDYEWFWTSTQSSLGGQTVFATSYTVNESQFPNNGGVEGQTGVSIKFRVRPKDTTGHSWRYISGTYYDYTV